MNNTIIGLDLAKDIFHLAALNSAGTPEKRKRTSRKQLRKFALNQEPCTIAMEACASAHFWGREFELMGHHVMLLPAQHVKAYLRGQKNDYNDATAIAEAAHHGRIRPVPIKSIEQQNDQALHRVRRQLVGERTRLINQLRGLLAEYGVVFPKTDGAFKRNIPLVLEDADNQLSERFRRILHRQYQRYLILDEEVTWYNNQLKQQAKDDEVCQRLSSIPGFGPVISTAFKGWIGTGKQFKRGRDVSAALGVVPRQHSTGGRDVLLGISKRGDPYLRSLMVQGARAVIRHAAKKEDKLSLWINRLVKERGGNKAAVALVNKLARIAWVIVTRNEVYRPVMN